MEIHHQGIIFNTAQSTCYYGPKSQQNSPALDYVLTSVSEWKGNLDSFLQVCRKFSVPCFFGGFLAQMASEGRTNGLKTVGLRALTCACWVTVVACVSVGWLEDRGGHRLARLFLASWRQVSLGSEHWILTRTLCDGPPANHHGYGGSSFSWRIWNI